MSDSSVSTRIASGLLSVHESSIKRWCNAGELEYWTTPGGHRRIPISRLVVFARERGLEGEIVNFGESAERVWVGLEAARRNRDFSILSKIALEWINLARVDMIEHLVPFLVHEGLSLGKILDEVLGSAMIRVGSAYASQELSVGDEHRLTNLIRDALLGIRKILSAEEKGGVPENPPTAIVGCIRGEIHEIGALMIRLLLHKSGWHVIYLGQDVPTEEFHAQALKHGADLICISLAPPRGTSEAIDAVSLLGSLFHTGRPVRIAVGGTALGTDAGELDVGISSGSIEEVRFFNRASPFEDWISGISG